MERERVRVIWRGSARTLHVATLTVALAFSLVACGGKAGQSGTPTPSPTGDEVHATLVQSRDALANATSAAVTLSVQLDLGEKQVVFAANLKYTAPYSIFGTVSESKGSFSVVADQDRIYAPDADGNMLRFDPLGATGLREYAGLIDMDQLATSLTGAQSYGGDSHVEKIRGSLPSIGFNSYIERLVEGAALTGIPAYLADSADIWVDRATRRPTRIELDGATAAPSGAHTGTFRIRFEFADYNKTFHAPPVPKDATPYQYPGLAAILTPTAVVPIGCAAGISVTALTTDAIGRVYHAGDTLSIAMRYAAPGCKSASAEFRGVYLAGSPHYKQTCVHQCGHAISAGFGSPEVALDGPSGVVTIPAAAGFPPTPIAGSSDQLEGFQLCGVTVTFNDGVIGGTFYDTVVGTPESGLDYSSAC